MKRYRELIGGVLLFVADLLLLNLIAWAAVYVRFFSYLVHYASGRPLWNSIVGFVGLTHLTLFPALAFTGAYRVARRWGANEAVPAVARALLIVLPATTALQFAVRLGVARSGLVTTPSRFVAFSVWSGLFLALTCVRLLAGRLQLALYRRGVAVRRAVIVGDGAEAARVADGIGRSPWLGENLLGRVGNHPDSDWMGNPKELADVLERHGVDVVWLAPPPDADPLVWLPPSLFSPDGGRWLWRILPEHFERLTATGLKKLGEGQRDLFYRRVKHSMELPILRVAMLGSRGVPANYGGVERYVEEVGAHLAAAGGRVAVYCHAKYVSARGEYRGMELRFVPAIRSKHLETISHTFLATLHALLHEEQIIHYQALGPSTLAWLPRLFGRKVVVTVQGLDWQRAKWGRVAKLYLKIGEWTSVHFPHATVVVSEVLAEHYAERHGKRPVHIPNGFDVPSIQPPNLIRKLGLAKDGYVLFVGRLVPEKGCHTLLHAFANVRTDKQLVIAGRAIYEDRYREQLDEEARGVSGVRFLGFVQGELLQELYSNAYLVVHPSETEGLSISLLEALSYGNCVLVSNTPESLEAINDAGYHFQADDSADLARQMQRLLDQPGQVEMMRSQVRTHLSDMDWSAVADATRKLYERVVAGHLG
jgi:glycosyltransferase involved in cell wall biosynthesis